LSGTIQHLLLDLGVFGIGLEHLEQQHYKSLISI
jgi:hypothetical protein